MLEEGLAICNLTMSVGGTVPGGFVGPADIRDKVLEPLAETIGVQKLFPQRGVAGLIELAIRTLATSVRKIEDGYPNPSELE